MKTTEEYFVKVEHVGQMQININSTEVTKEKTNNMEFKEMKV